jgi:signal-transduction protein with cAMP-binding, CBS, and nucleotidyltransferase domain
MLTEGLICRSDVTVPAEASVHEAASSVKENAVSAILVLDGSRKAGILNEDDLEGDVAVGLDCEMTIDVMRLTCLPIGSERDDWSQAGPDWNLAAPDEQC